MSKAPTKVLGIVFAMRYPDDVGYVWDTIAKSRDLTAKELGGGFQCYLAYPLLTGKPSYCPEYMPSVAVNFYSKDANDQCLIEGFIQKNNIRLVFYMSANPDDLPMHIFKKYDVKTINTENNSFDANLKNTLIKDFGKLVKRRVFKKGLHDLHLLNSTGQYSFFLNYGKYPANKCKLIYDGVDAGKFNPGDKLEACRSLGLDGSKFWILSVFQARPEKRYQWVVAAAEAVLKKYKEDVGFIHVGAGQLFDEFRSSVEGKGISTHFHFAGEKKDLLPYYRASSVMIHSAEKESFGLAIVEAMASGVSVVVTNTMGPSEIVINNRTGFIVELNDFDDFVEKIEFLKNNPTDVERLGKAACADVSDKFSIFSQAKQFSQAIRDLV